MEEKTQIVMYHPNESISIDVMLDHETVWLTQAQMSILFQTTKQNISLHIANIFKDGELERDMVVKKSLTTTRHGAIESKTQHHSVIRYNLDVIISVGYRVKSKQGVHFRQWASSVLKEYLLRGYAFRAQLEYVERRINNQLMDHEYQLSDLSEKVDFLVRAHTEPTEQIFPAGCVFDAWNYVSGLVRSAEKRVILIDKYVDERVLSLLNKRQANVSAEIYSRYDENFLVDLEKHNSQYPHIDFIQLPHRSHDRFLIIDDTVYLLGASVKDMGVGLCAITQMEVSAEDILASHRIHR